MKRSYIEDVLSFRANSICTSILDVVIQRTCSPLGQAVFCINIKRIYIEDVLSFRANSILDQYQTRTVFTHQSQTQLYRGRALLYGRQYYTSILDVVIKRTCSALGQTVFCINIKRSYIEDVPSFRTDVFIRQYQTQSIEDVLSFRADSIFHQYQTQLYRGRALHQGGPYLHINIKRSYIEDVLSFREDSIYTSILDVVIQRTCSPLRQTVSVHQYKRLSYRGRALLQCRQYLHINIKRSYREDVLSFRADSIYTSILYVVIQRTCFLLGQRVFCITIKRSYIEDVLSFTADSIYTSL